MDVIESIKKDKAYIKCKMIVKGWEKEFKTKFSRIPSKLDIKEAPAKIKYAYKKYFHLKSAALDSTLSACDFDLDYDQNLSPEPTLSSENITSSLSPKTEQLMQTLPSGKELEELLSSSVSKPLENTATSDLLPASTTTEQTKLHKLPSPLGKQKTLEVKQMSPFTSNLSKKLFQGRSFSIRNPRKLSINKSLSQSTDVSMESSMMLDNSSIDTMSLNNTKSQSPESEARLENNLILDNCSLDTVTCSSHVPSLNNMELADYTIPLTIDKSSIVANKTRQLDEAWIERATGMSGLRKNKSPKKVPFGLSNIKFIPDEKPCDIVENSDSETDDLAIEKLKPALKKRKIEYSPQNIQLVKNNEEYSKSKDNGSGKTKKKKSKMDTLDIDQHPPDILEFLPFGVDSNITPRHENIDNAIMSAEKSLGGKNTIKENISEGMNKLDKKIKSGTLNENFVKINIEKKTFVRGHKHINYSKYKKQQFKNKKALHGGMEFPEAGKVLCFKCGLSGHMARYCTAHRGDQLLPMEGCEEEDNIPTLEDMEIIASSSTNPKATVTEQLKETLFQPSTIPDSFLRLLGETSTSNNVDIEPIYNEVTDEIPEEIMNVLKMFGHTNFRPGQQETIMRILCGMSTLLLLSTGGGKSLCYQIPAYVYSQHYRCITLVISPLVSLMEDQVASMPEFLKAGCLHTNQPPTQRQKVIKCIKDGQLNILLISPEALIAGDSSNGFSGLFKSLPPIAFVCIDEAHCVSQWSHNFRPSYLMLCNVLREKLKVNCILGLTATASQSTISSVIDHINVPDGLSGVIVNPAVPDNLILSVSFEKDKDKALIALLSSDLMETYCSIIVYCIRRDECERVAAILRSSLQEPGKQNMEKPSKKRKRMSYIAEAYHAGLSAAQRRKIQNYFMDGTLRIIVATVAFGMGINKSDIRSIIHYNMPRSFESYVQEIGRAGRDGKPAHCHVFMSKNTNDKNELLKHIHSDTIDRPTIRKLLQRVFVPCDCNKNTETICKGHEVAIPIDTTVEELDLPSENISTLLCYLELHEKKYIKVLNNAYTTCKIMSYGGPQKILEAAKTCPPLAMAYVLENKRNPDITKNNIFEFNVIETAAAIGWESGMVKYHLKNLEWISDGNSSRRSQLKVEFNTLGFRFKAPGDLKASELDKMLDDLHGAVLLQEKSMLYQLEEINRAFTEIGSTSIESSETMDLTQKSNDLKKIIVNYFERVDNFDEKITLEERPLDEERVAADVRSLIVSYKDCTFTGRSIAKIFQGISSPNYPAIVWGRCKFWRAHIHEDFYGIVRIATHQLLQMK